MLTAPQIEAQLNAGAVIADIGQLSSEHKRALDLMARRKQIAKWRGKWFPVAGFAIGIGPDKNCYATFEARARVVGA